MDQLYEPEPRVAVAPAARPAETVDEAARLSRLYALRILDSDPEQLFDSLASAAAAACGGGIGLVNLLDRDRLWCKATSGDEARPDLPRRHAICAHVVDGGAAVEVEDLRADARFDALPFVRGGEEFRFYAGVPLRLDDGACVGALCVLDVVPRILDEGQRRILRHLATAAVRALEARRLSLAALGDAKRAHLALERLYDAAPAVLQATDAEGRLTRVTDRWLAEFGYVREAVIGRCFAELTDGPDGNGLQASSEAPDGPCRVRHSDGRLLDMHASSMTGHNRDGASGDRVTVLENVTQSLVTRAALEHSESFLERTGAVAGIGGWELDLVTQRVVWSDHTCRLHGREPGHVPTLEEGLAYYTPEALPLITEALRRATEHGEPYDLELPLVCANGRPFWARVVASVEMRDGRPARLSGAFQDITARKLLEQQLSESRQMLAITLQSIGDAVITTGTGSEVRWMNPAAEQLTGWSTEEARGVPLGLVMPVDDRSTANPLERAVLRCLAGGAAETVADDAMLQARSGAASAIQASTAAIRDDASGVQGAVVVFRDVSEQRRQQEEMRRRATYDSLTGLLNRAGLMASLDELLRQVRTGPHCTHALLYVDLDRFKVVNDSCGHPVGDQLLQEISRLLRHAVRSGDIVSRLGGDEFCLVLVDCSEQEAAEVAERIRAQVDCYRLFHESCSYRVGTSIGLVPIDGRWTGLQALLQAGDVSCYAAKEAGRNCVHSWSEADGAGADHPAATQWVARLESALGEDRFELYGQRIARIGDADGDDSGGLRCEVLLRMRERDGGLLLPGAFIVAAERFHMAPLIDRWVLRRVLDRLEDGGAEGIALLSVNLSGQSLGDRAFHAEIVGRIRQARFDTGVLCLEITETSAIARFSDAKPFIDEIRALGVKVALDDFGAGASSFSYLKNLTVDLLKIDGQFVRSLPADPLDLAAIRCFRDIARSVGIGTVAEFVERHDQYDALAALGIDLVQGYMIHRPEPLAGLLPPVRECRSLSGGQPDWLQAEAPLAAEATSLLAPLS